MNLFEQLQSSLSGSYTVERELGGGGMSRVFIAHEAALGRKVVLKLLPHELSGAVSAERFRREIQFAAGLHHPHIVPVLSAGDADGLLYYTMPLVEGETLRALLTREGPLPASRAIPILRDVAKALAYAHGKGIVHRDIKPENILLTGHAATVTDFGIAKAVSAARAAEISLTQTGTSLGTPLYMAPEQWAGDPGTDHRADLYAFGCLAYELLTGRPPFAGTSPHALIAAHMQDTAEPVLKHAPETPEAIAQLVMQCLEKEPVKRPQSAEAILARLEGLQATYSSEYNLPALRRVLGFYGVSFAVVAILAWAAMIGLGLPDWVMPGAILVMALGLPAILLNVYVYRAARAGHALAQRVMSLLSWRRTALAGVLSIGLFALSVAAYMTLRAYGIGAAGTLVASGRFAPNDRLIVSDFTVNGLDSNLGPAFAEAARTALQQSRTISIMTPAELIGSLERMRRPQRGELDLDLARQIAQREGIRAVVHGEVTPLGTGYLVGLRLVAPDSGNTVQIFHATAATPDRLLGAIDDVTRQLRSKIGESLKWVRADPPLARVTTESLEALRHHTAGVRALNSLNFSTAAEQLEQAIALDSGFAMAWRALSAANGNLGRFPEMNRAAEMAYRFRDRATERERYHIDARYHVIIKGDRATNVRLLEEHDRRYPVAPTNNLIQSYLNRREFARAESLQKLLIARNPTAITYGNLPELLVNQGKLAEAESVLSLAAVSFPDGAANWQLGRARTMYAKGDWDAYERALDTLAMVGGSVRGVPSRAVALRMLAALALTRGQLGEYERLGRTAQRLMRAGGATNPNALQDSLTAAIIDILVRRRTDDGLRRLDATVNGILSKMQPARPLTLMVARLYALGGQPGRAHATLQRYLTEQRDTVLRRVDEPHIENVKAYIALAEGRYAEALAAFRAADVRPDGPINVFSFSLPRELGVTFEAAGRVDSAIAMLELYVALPNWQRHEMSAVLLANIPLHVDPVALADAYERLGQLHEMSGNHQRAAHYYTRFVDLWKNADTELQPRVGEARRRLANLQRRTG
ncbi:MAG: protein kinase [Gemmatimonadaceae bacterium]